MKPKGNNRYKIEFSVEGQATLTGETIGLKIAKFVSAAETNAGPWCVSHSQAVWSNMKVTSDGINWKEFQPGSVTLAHGINTKWTYGSGRYKVHSSTPFSSSV